MSAGSYDNDRVNRFRLNRLRCFNFDISYEALNSRWTGDFCTVRQTLIREAYASF